MRKSLLVLLVGASTAAALAQFAVPVRKPTRPIPAIEHVLVISIDGLRPDRALLADTPTLHALIREGAFTMWARTTAVSITLPSHTSMVTGVTPRKHGIEWNADLPLKEPIYPKVPTVMEMATRAGYVTAMIAGKVKFGTLNKPGTITHVFVAADPGTNDMVAAHAEEVITRYKPDFLFVHFPDVDAVGHAKGWGSPEQLAKIGETDRELARVLAALDQAGIRQSTFVLVTADHGGAGLTHGPEDARSRTIPWIAVGPGVKKNFDLTQLADLTVNTEDTCATACYLLGLPQQPYFDGKPVYQAFERAP